MKRLKDINQSYSLLKSELDKIRSEHHKEQTKSIEQSLSEKKDEFIVEANQYVKENNLKPKSLIIYFIDEWLQEQEHPLDKMLLLWLMWNDKTNVNDLFLNKVEQLIFKILEPELTDFFDEYIIEMLIDYWNYESVQPIPLNVLEKVLLIKHKEEYKYGAYVKAISYLNNHATQDIHLIHEKIKQTEKYKNDEYYRDWINE